MSQSGQGPVAVRTFRLAAHGAFERHVHDRHQLAVATGGVLSIVVGDHTWVLPPTRALWIPAGVPHTTGSAGAAAMRSAYLARRGCPVRWREPTAVAADDLLVALVRRLEDPDLSDPRRRRLLAVLFDTITPVPAATVATPLPSDAAARQVAERLLADPADDRTVEQWGRAVRPAARHHPVGLLPAQIVVR